MSEGGNRLILIFHHIFVNRNVVLIQFLEALPFSNIDTFCITV